MIVIMKKVAVRRKKGVSCCEAKKCSRIVFFVVKRHTVPFYSVLKNVYYYIL